MPFPWKLGRELLKFSRGSQPAAPPTPSLQTQPNPSLETRPFSSSIVKDLDVSSAFRKAKLEEARSAPNPPCPPCPPENEVQPASSTPCPLPKEARPAPGPPCSPCQPTRRLSPLPTLAAGGGLATLLFTLLQPATTSNPLEIQAESRSTSPSPIQQTSNDGRPSQEYIEDPCETDPKRDERLLTITQKPCNAESPGDEFAESFPMPNEVFYDRNHTEVPVVEDTRAEDHNISIEIPDGEVKTYTLHDLKTRFEQHTVSAVPQCSGNRRKDMPVHAKKTNGLQWTVGAISCAKWEGVRLRDVLADAGVRPGDPGDVAQHVHFSGLEAYGASIPITSALDPRGNVLLAFKMNGQLLPRDHGFPVRVIMPGHVAARCVKWVNKIVVSDNENPTQWQRRDYKCFRPNETVQDWDKYKSIQEMPITSATARVDLRLDGSLTWAQAKLLDDANLDKGNKASCWTRWRYESALPPSPSSPSVVDGKQQKGGMVKTKTKAKAKMRMTFVVKATDDAYNSQPEYHASTYNPRGNLATARHRVDFQYAITSASPGARVDAASAIAADKNGGTPVKGRHMLMNKSKRVSGLHS